MADESRPSPGVAIIASVVWGVSLFIGVFMAMMSVMMFDAPGSQNNPRVIAMFVSVVSFPVLCLVSILATWLAWRFTRDASAAWRRLPWYTAALPLLSVIAFAIAAIIQGDRSFGN